MDRAAWTEALGAVFENAPWVAAAAWEARPFGSAADLHAAMAAAVRRASVEKKLALLHGHPELAGALARSGGMTDDSKSEQASVGLDRLSEDEHARFARLNVAYRDKFGFPFIIAVRDYDKAAILETFERRLRNGAKSEIEAALEQVCRIARIRLDAAGIEE